jgi:hypothetical protein
MPSILFKSAAACLACLLAVQTAGAASPPRRDVGQLFRQHYRWGDPARCEPPAWAFSLRGYSAHRPCWPHVWTCQPPDQRPCLFRP